MIFRYAVIFYSSHKISARIEPIYSVLEVIMAQIYIQSDYFHQQMACIVKAIQSGMEKQALISYVQNVEKQIAEKVEEPAFNYDLDRMKAHVESKEIAVPKCNSPEELDKWLMSL